MNYIEILMLAYVAIFLYFNLISTRIYSKLFSKYASIISEAFPISEMKTVNTIIRRARIKQAIRSGKISDPDFIKDFTRARLYWIISISLLAVPGIILFIVALQTIKLN